jgi:ABC-type spermidine/putrescine transport system permease subunit II
MIGEFLVHKAFFALAVMFLIVAIVLPVVILLMQPGNSLDNNIIIQNPSGMQTEGNVSLPTSEQTQQQQTTTLIIAAVEVVFISLIVVTLYYGLKTHPVPKTSE